MTDEQMVAQVKALVADGRLDQYAEAYLGLAKGAVTSHLFPYADDATWEDVPAMHHARTVEIAVYLVNRRGSEGETSHQESGTSRSYESAGIPRSYFSGMVPRVGVPS